MRPFLLMITSALAVAPVYAGEVSPAAKLATPDGSKRAANKAVLQMPPASAHLEYAVLRDGSEVGRHVVDIARQGNATDVTIKTQVAVSIAFITVYRFEHAAREHWSGTSLLSLKSRTNDNGTHHELSVASAGDHLDVGADGGKSTAPAHLLPASLWNASTVAQSSLLNTLDGHQMRVAVSDQGEDTVKVHGARTAAHHYKISGGLARELWFDRTETLVRVAFAADDGSHIVYELQ
ncbi:MAG TPA: DUF6134 family protein [Hyphomicrobium sp.]|nr:DUF6134 family protein [Hyphomicrobium sp.]